MTPAHGCRSLDVSRQVCFALLVPSGVEAGASLLPRRHPGTAGGREARSSRCSERAAPLREVAGLQALQTCSFLLFVERRYVGVMTRS